MNGRFYPRKFSMRIIIVLSFIQYFTLEPAIGQSNCRLKTEEYITRFKSAISKLPADPGTDVERDQYLDSVRLNNPEFYNRIARLSMEAQTNIKRDDSWLPCFQQEFLNVNPTAQDETIIRWSAHLFKRLLTFDFRSPEFEKGVGIHLDASQGAADLGRQSEAYSFAARVLLAYTFSNEVAGGRVRILGGVSTYYFERRFLWFANPRLEYRIVDLGNDLATLGNLKAILDANFGKTWIAGAGVGLELHNFGVQLMYQRQGRQKSSQILVGLFYRFLK
jgi:hypothetical protein